jgi:hypothetical protein
MTALYLKTITVGNVALDAASSTNNIILAGGDNVSLSADPATNAITISAAAFEGPLTISQDEDTNATRYIVFSASLNGALTPRTDTSLHYNPFTNTLTAGVFNGPSSGWSTARTVSFSGGDVTGSFSIDGTADVSNVVLSLAGATYTLPTATTSVLGGVKVDGTTVTIDGNGVISSASAYSLPTATTSVLGGVKVDGTTVTIDGNGVISSVGGEGQTADVQNIYNEIINNYLIYSDIAGAPTPVDDINQLGDLNNILTSVAITGVTYPNNGSSVSTAGNETVILTGTGFQRACNVLINNAPAVSTSFVNSTSVQFITTAQTAGTYIITLINPDATTAVLSPGIQYLAPGAPRFVDPPGQLAAYSRNLSVSKTLSITGGTAPYTITILSGALPSGLSLNSSTGVISGTTPDVTFDTVFNFVAQVSDSEDPVRSTTSSFYILVALPIPVELTIGGPGVSGASTIISNNVFFIEYEEDITNAPTITISGSSIISNNIFFVEYEEDITNSPTFTITGTAIKSYTPV